MGVVLVTFKIMPESVDVHLEAIEEEVRGFIHKFGGSVGSVEKEPIAFGLIALNISFSLDEHQSNLDPLEDQIRNVKGVSSVEVVDVRRAIV